MTSRWAIVGGGVLGLELARRLAGPQRRITIYEAGPSIGGLASAWSVGPVTWDRFYHVVLRSDARTRAMLGRLGLEDAIVWARPRTGLFAGGTVRPLNGAGDYLRIPGLSVVDKARLGATLTIGAKLGSLDRLESVAVDAWLRRWSGERAFERLWRSLLRAKLGDAYPRVSAAFIAATARRLAKARKGGVSGDEFGVVRGGYARVLDAFARVLGESGVEIKLDAPVASIERAGGAIRVRSGEQDEAYDRVVVTASPRAAARMCQGLRAEERDAFERVEYQGVVCVSAVLDRPLTGNYLTYVTDPGVAITTVIDMTAVAGADQFGGRGLIYLPRYVAASDEVFGLDDDAVTARFLDAARGLYPELAEREIVATRVARAREVFALPTLGYTVTLPHANTSIEGVTMASSAWIPFAPLNVDETLGHAERCAEELDRTDGMRSMPAGARA